MRMVIVLIIMCILSWILLIFCIENPLPEVRMSNSTKKCVKIIVEGVEYDCKNMPKRYRKVWVK